MDDLILRTELDKIERKLAAGKSKAEIALDYEYVLDLFPWIDGFVKTEGRLVPVGLPLKYTAYKSRK